MNNFDEPVKKAEGRETYTTGELVDEVVLPIIKL